MLYSSVVLAVIVAFAVLALETIAARSGVPSSGPRRSQASAPRRSQASASRRSQASASQCWFFGLAGSPGFHLAAWGVVLVVLAAPIDDLWHRLFGLDVTLWSAPHLLGLFGSAVNTFGMLVIAREVYEPRTARGLTALLLAGSLLYGGIRIVLDPAYLLAYHHGGVLFHAYSILAALVLPAALVPTTRFSGRRWAPVAMILIVTVLSLSGDAIAWLGFQIVKPVSVIDQEIKKDPSSPIAAAHTIQQKNGPRPISARLIPFVPAIVMAMADPRMRPVTAALAYGVGVFAISGWYLATRPAYQSLVPTAAETAIALVLCGVAALIGAMVARWLTNYMTGPMIQGANSSSPTPDSSLLERLPDATSTISSKI